MAWLRIDDTVPEHRKMLQAGPAACWLWVCGIAYCQRQLTDGFIPEVALPMLGVGSRVKKLADALVTAGLFECADGGYRIHDYHDHNATRDEAMERRQELRRKRAAAGRQGGLRSGEARREATKQNGSNAPKQNEAPTRPDPYKNPPTPHAVARGAKAPTRAERKRAAEVLRIRFGACKHNPTCVSHESCLVAVVAELRAKAGAA